MVSTDKGYIIVYRDIRDHWVWQDKPFSRGQAWIDLLMMVNHEEKTISFDGHPIVVGRGQTMTSLQKLASRWGWGRAKVKRFLDDLKTQQMIDKKRNSRGTLLTVVNYGFYQGARNSKRNNGETIPKQSRNTDGHKQYTKEYTKEYTKKEAFAPLAPGDLVPLTPEEIEEGGWEG